MKSRTIVKVDGNVVRHHNGTLGVQTSQYVSAQNGMVVGRTDEIRKAKTIGRSRGGKPRHFVYTAIDGTIRVGRYGKVLKVAEKKVGVL